MFRSVILIVVLMILPIFAQNQQFVPLIKPPKPESLKSAREMVDNLFADLEAGKSQKIAEWITDQVGYTWDASTRVQKINEFKSQLDIVMISPPASSYGELDGYDLIDESYLPGSDRYFRLTYLSYHEGAPLIWEFRFYVKPDGKTTLNAIQWDDKNPFEYMSTVDMLLNRYYDR